MDHGVGWSLMFAACTPLLSAPARAGRRNFLQHGPDRRNFSAEWIEESRDLVLHSEHRALHVHRFAKDRSCDLADRQTRRMTNDIRFDLQQHGFVTRTAHLIRLGHGRRSIGRAISRGDILRVCEGWVATTDASQTSIIAIANRGKLSGSTALATRGVWDGVDHRIHVQVPVNSHGSVRRVSTPLAAFTPPKHPMRGVVRHWTHERRSNPLEPPWRVSVIDALVQVAKIAPREQFIACVESAVCKKELTRAGIPILFSLLPQRLQSLSSSLDFGSESGLETIARLRLAPCVRRIVTQVKIPGIAKLGGDGRVDLLIDGWLVIELDGDEFHDPVADRERNAALVRLGYRVHRFGYDQVINGWPLVEATVLELLRYPPTAARRG